MEEQVRARSRSNLFLNLSQPAFPFLHTRAQDLQRSYENLKKDIITLAQEYKGLRLADDISTLEVSYIEEKTADEVTEQRAYLISYSYPLIYTHSFSTVCAVECRRGWGCCPCPLPHSEQNPPPIQSIRPHHRRCLATRWRIHHHSSDRQHCCRMGIDDRTQCKKKDGITKESRSITTSH